MQPKLLNLAPDKLNPNTFNTNIVSPENEARLEASIRRNGLFKPVIVREVDDGFEIIGGQHRWEAAKRLGLTEIPVVNLGKVDDLKAKEISVLDNSRYGADDTVAFAELLKSIGDAGELQDFLPYAAEDIDAIFSSIDIALDDLDIDEDFEKTPDEVPEPPAAKAPKTHTIMRFKLSLLDAERLTKLIASTQKQHGFTGSDELTNAGDALVHLLFSQGEGGA